MLACPTVESAASTMLKDIELQFHSSTCRDPAKEKPVIEVELQSLLWIACYIIVTT
jgi:hypothetical protein